jgi:predicted nucleic acid-binding Zn ribbon protein
MFHVNHDDEPEVPPPLPQADAPKHDDTGLDLARTVAKAIAGAARNAPRKKRRPADRKAGKGKRVPKVSGAHPDERDPQLLDTTLSRLIDDHGWALDLKVHSVFGRWPDIVGIEVANHCAPISFADGKLVVRTDSTAWATQLRLLAPTLVRRLNEELGHGSVTVIVVEGPKGPSWKKGRLGTRDGRGPRDTYG